MSNLKVNTLNRYSGTALNIGTTNSGDTITIGHATSEVVVGDNLTVKGDLTVTGSMNVQLSDFTVSATAMVLGDQSSDTLTINAATAATPNGLNFDSNTLVIDASNNRVGIGTATPSGKLVVYRNDEFTGEPTLAVEQDGTGDAFSKWILTGAATYTMGIDNSDSSKLKIGYHATSPSEAVNTNTRMTITTIGRVGIGTNDPSQLLDVAGSLNLGSSSYMTLSDNEIDVSSGNLTLDVAGNIILDATQNIGIGTATPSTSAGISKFIEISDATSAGVVLHDTGGREWNIYSADGKLFHYSDYSGGTQVLTLWGSDVGINTAAPTKTLDVNGDARIGDDLFLQSDAAVLNFGTNDDVSLTHVHDTGLLLNSSRQLQFGDSGTYIHQSADGVLDLVADTEIEINATTIDMNGAVDISGALTVTGVLDADAGVTIDNITIDGTEIDLSSGDLTLDVAGDIVLDAAGEEVIFKDGSTNVGHVSMDSDNLTIKSLVSDKDIIFQGNDGGSAITAMTIDMSAAGNVGIGETTPLGKLHVKTGDSPISTIDDKGDELVLEGSGNVGLSLLAGAIHVAGIYFPDASDPDIAYIKYDHGSNGMAIRTNGTDAITIDSSQTVTATANLTVTGDLTVSGTTTTVNTTTVTVEDPVIKLGQSSSDDNKDRGVEFAYNDGSARLGFMGWDDSASGFTMLSAASNSSEVFSGTAAPLVIGALTAASLDISGNADIDGTLEADAITVDGTTLAEVISDTAGAMFSSNTETGITATYQDADNTIDLAIAAAQTTITSLLATDIKIGEDDETKIDFETANEIHFYANNVEQVYLADNIFGPQSDSDVDLGTTGVRWKDAFIDTVTTTGDLDVGGNIELGHASDTTIARSSAGKVTIEGSEVIVAGAVTGITSLLATDIKIGEDDETKIDFETVNEIHFYAANAEQVYVADGILGPQTDSDVDLGSSTHRFKDAYVDSVSATGAIAAGSTLACATTLTVGTDLTVTGGDIAYGNGQAATLSVAATSAGTVGKNLTISAGEAPAASGNTNGGDLILSSGAGDGTGTSSMQFKTKISGTDATAERMRIHTDGKVGIGVADPDAQLEVLSTGTQLKASYDSDSFATVTVADASHTTVATGESGNLILDVAGDITLDAAGEEVIFKDGSTNVGHVSMDSDNLTIKSLVSDKDMIFQGNDGGSAITALTLDMSAAGAASFNNNVTVGNNLAVTGTSAFSSRITSDAGIVVDNITIDGTEIDLSSGDLTIDVAGDIELNADGGQVNFKDGSDSHMAVEMGPLDGDGNAITTAVDLKLLIDNNAASMRLTQADGIITAMSQDWSGSGAFSYKKPVIPVTAALDLSSPPTAVGYMGAVLTVSTAGSAYAITLPSTTDADIAKQLLGWHIRIMILDQSALTTDEAVTVVRGASSGINGIFGNVYAAAEDAASDKLTIAGNTITFTSGCGQGDYVDITCVNSTSSGQVYHATGFAST